MSTPNQIESLEARISELELFISENEDNEKQVFILGRLKGILHDLTM